METKISVLLADPGEQYRAAVGEGGMLTLLEGGPPL